MDQALLKKCGCIVANRYDSMVPYFAETIIRTKLILMYHKRCMRIFYRQLVVLSCTIRFAEALVMDYLALSEQADRVADVRVVGETEDIVVGCAGFLLCGEVFVKVGYDVALRLEIGRGERSSRGGDRVDAGRMVNEVITEAAGFYLVDGESLCELIKYS